MLFVAGVVLAFSIGADPKPKAPAPPPPDPVTVRYIGRGDYEPIDGRVALGFFLAADGTVYAGSFLLDDESFVKNLASYAKGHKRIALQLTADDPAKTTLKAVSKAAAYVRKHAPKGVEVVVYVADGQIID